MPPGDNDRIESILKAYKNWADLHQASDMSHFKTLGDKIPFFSESSVSQIHKDVRAFSNTTEADKSIPDFLLQARIFLQMAQEFDERNLEIVRNLNTQTKMEKGLYRRLRGDDDSLPELENMRQPLRYHDPFHYMLADRLRAWSTIFMADDRRPGLFITNSRDVIDMIADVLTKTEEMVPVGSLSAFDESCAAIEQMQSKLIDHLKTLSMSVTASMEDPVIREESMQASAESPALDIYLIAGVDPADLFSRFAPPTLKRNDPGDGLNTARNTIICHIEKKHKNT
jgi:hypothetical protein